MIAGSNFNFLASIGRRHPSDFESITVAISDTPTTIPRLKFLYIKVIPSAHNN